MFYLQFVFVLFEVDEIIENIIAPNFHRFRLKKINQSSQIWVFEITNTVKFFKNNSRLY